MAETAGEKSFEATAHRRQEAREKGQVVFSQDLGSAAMLMLSTLLLMMMGGAVVAYSATLMRKQLGEVPRLHAAQENLVAEWIHIIYALSAVLLPIFGLMMLGGVLTNILQVGFLWVPDRLARDIRRISPMAGL